MTIKTRIDDICETFADEEGLVKPEGVRKALEKLPEWEADEETSSIRRTFSFKNYYQTMAFVNAAAWIAHTRDHHPDLTVSYNSCGVTFTTHSAGGLTKNDFSCAEAVSGLVDAE